MPSSVLDARAPVLDRRARTRLPAPTPAPPGILWWVAGSIALLSLAAWTAVALGHLTDRYAIDHVAGAWMTLADEAAHGRWYPALDAGTMLGGTRNMPAAIGLLALAAQLGGGLLVSGKIVCLTTFAALMVTVAWVVRRRGTTAVAAVVVATGLLAGRGLWDLSQSIRPDPLSVCLQLWAIIVAGRRGRHAPAISGALCGLAWLTKLSAVWGLLAIVGWYALQRRWRSAAVTAGAFAVVAAGLGLAFDAASDGRMLANLTSLSASGVDGVLSLVKAGGRMVLTSAEAAPLLLLVGPLAAWAALRSAREHTVDLWACALVAAGAVTFVVFIDRGAYANHLIDLVAVSLVVASAPGAHVGPGSRARPALPVVGVIVAAATVALLLTMPGELAAAVRPSGVARGGDGALLPTSIARRVPPDELRTGLLTDAPYLWLGGDVRPPIQDAFMVRVRTVDDPSIDDEVVEAIEEQRYRAVALVMPLRSGFYERTHFGPGVAAALERNYRPAGIVPGDPGMQVLFVYEPTAAADRAPEATASRR